MIAQYKKLMIWLVVILLMRSNDGFTMPNSRSIRKDICIFGTYKDLEMDKSLSRRLKFLAGFGVAISLGRPAMAMGPNLAGPSMQKEVTGMELAEKMAQLRAARQLSADKKATDDEGSRIFKEKGSEAYQEFMREIEAKRLAQKEQSQLQRDELIRDMILLQHIDPFKSLKGKAMLYMFDKGIDLYKVPGTEQEAFDRLKKMFPDKYGDVEARQKEATRLKVHQLREQGFADHEIVSHFLSEGTKLAKLGDGRARDKDKLQSIREKNKKNILPLPPQIPPLTDTLDQSTQEIAEEDTQTKDNEELKATKQHENEELKATKQNENEELKIKKQKEKEELKAKKQKEKEELKIKKQKEKEELKIKKQKEKEELKAKKQKDKEEANAAKAEAKEKAKLEAAKKKQLAEEQKAEAKALKEKNEEEAAKLAAPLPESPSEPPPEEIETNVEQSDESDSITPFEPTPQTNILTANNYKIPKIIAGTSILGASSYVSIKFYNDRSKEKELERERQFDLLMGTKEQSVEPPSEPIIESPSPYANTDPEQEVDIMTPQPKFLKKSPPVQPQITQDQSLPPSKDKNKGRGGTIASLFKKNASTRPNTLAKVFSSTPHASFAQTLSQVLTLGAPGRFPDISPPNMPYKDNLINLKASIPIDQAAELFANVVNCMLIHIVDLASTTVKKKDNDKLVVEAVSIVLDFMDFSAQLYEDLFNDYTISPVTYSGTLSKSKLENLFSTYATAQMTNFETGLANDQDRVDTLQRVFNIPDKRAEGLLQKTLMKNFMSMMKDGEADGGAMAEMMKGLAGAEGGQDEVNPEDIQSSIKLMKELMESGSISKEEIALVKEQFSEVYGTDINKFLQEAEGEEDNLDEDGKELLNLFKDVLKE